MGRSGIVVVNPVELIDAYGQTPFTREGQSLNTGIFNFFTDGGKARIPRVFDLDTSSASEYVTGVSLRRSSSAGSIEIGSQTNPIFIEHKMYPTFTATGLSITIGNNKNMMSITNTGSSVIRLREIYVINSRTTAITGVAGIFDIKRITSITSGTSIAILTHDTTDSNPSGVVVETGGTINGEATDPIARRIFSTDEWGPGTSDQEGAEKNFQMHFPIYTTAGNAFIKPITIRNSEGIMVAFKTNSANGTFDIQFVFTQEG